MVLVEYCRLAALFCPFFLCRQESMSVYVGGERGYFSPIPSQQTSGGKLTPHLLEGGVSGGKGQHFFLFILGL